MQHCSDNDFKGLLKIETLNLIKEIIPKENILVDEPMKLHTTFRIGGNAKYFVSPSSADEIVELVRALKNNGQKYMVIGNGSNLLVSDKGYDGTVVCIGKNMSDVKVEGNVITALSGALLSKIASVAQKNSLSGFEFASGIPGTLGGAVVMNAGAYGGEMKDVVTKTGYISSDGTIKTVSGDRHSFAYRRSVFVPEDVILYSEITLQEGNKDEIKALMTELNTKRKDKQPLEYPSAGSTFKRPEGYFAGKLIEDAGLKGFAIGGAMVSQKHSGFVINTGDATAQDVVNLIKHIQDTVSDKFGVLLETEVKFVGEF